MKIRLRWSQQAEQDVLDIYETISFDNHSAAERMFDSIDDAVARLVHYPRMGTRRPDIAINARQLVVHPYVVLYRTEPDSDDGEITLVEIVRVAHGHQDLVQAVRR